MVIRPFSLDWLGMAEAWLASVRSPFQSQSSPILEGRSKLNRVESSNTYASLAQPHIIFTQKGM